jgi:hypothetical protein
MSSMTTHESPGYITSDIFFRPPTHFIPHTRGRALGTRRNALSLFAYYKRRPARECLLSSLCSLLLLTSGVRVWLTSRLRQSLFGTASITIKLTTHARRSFFQELHRHRHSQREQCRNHIRPTRLRYRTLNATRKPFAPCTGPRGHVMT